MSHQSRQAFAAKDVTFATLVLPRSTLRQRLAISLKVWRARTMARRDLAMMDARSLRDAGISPAAAAYESGKTFWQAFGPLR
jgi:uncharacterized protein YjiS (DUF1127 family)